MSYTCYNVDGSSKEGCSKEIVDKPFSLTEKDLENADEFAVKLVTLAEIIFRKHFYASYRDKEDLISIGVLKAYKLLDGGQWSRGRGSLYNYIYAGMRNDMHNYLYHINREVSDFDSQPEEAKSDEYFSDDACLMDYRIIHIVCIDFEREFGSDIEDRVIQELTERGFTTINRDGNDSHTGIKKQSTLKDRYGTDIESDIIGRIVGLVLWKWQEVQNTY